MHNISPARAMVRRARQYLTTGAVLALVGVLGLALLVLLVVIPFSRAAWYGGFQVILGGIGVVLLLMGGGLMVRGVLYPTDNPRAQQMAAVLARSLDYRYTFIRSLNRRGLGYVDAVLVGPNGALVFYFFHQPGQFICERNLWFVHERGQAQPKLSRLNPTHQVVKDVGALRRYFGERGLEQIPVYAVVVLTNPRTAITVTQPVVPVAQLNDVPTVLRDTYLAEDRIDAGMVKAVVQVLMQGS
ncbi:MAG: NERD domain-containing protein [Anaerolineae bacterium]|nr:NERD domain-containing protein [Anaerolineae bacterium]